jgi:hypothetical protein
MKIFMYNTNKVIYAQNADSDHPGGRSATYNIACSEDSSASYRRVCSLTFGSRFTVRSCRCAHFHRALVRERFPLFASVFFSRAHK